MTNIKMDINIGKWGIPWKSLQNVVQCNKTRAQNINIWGSYGILIDFGIFPFLAYKVKNPVSGEGV